VPKLVERVMTLPYDAKIEELRREFGESASVAPHLERFASYLAHLDALGVRAWVDLDLSIVRGLAYYTGIVFELFDAKGELRAICGGGRYDNLLSALGGSDLPALGFGMGDVVLGELLKERRLVAPSRESATDLYVIGGNGALEHPIDDALRLVRLLRDEGFSVDYALNADRYQTQPSRNQFDAARKSGARAAVYFENADEVVVHGLSGKVAEAPRKSFDAALLLEANAAEWHLFREWCDAQFPVHGGRPARQPSSK
jgi:histidyl-tRNA synthetase